MGVAIFEILYINYKIPLWGQEEKLSQKEFTIRLPEQVNFLNKAGFSILLNKIRPGTTVIIDGSQCLALSPDVREIIEDFIPKAKDMGIHLKIKKIKGLEDLELS
jgi:hypothetical protein